MFIKIVFEAGVEELVLNINKIISLEKSEKHGWSLMVDCVTILDRIGLSEEQAEEIQKVLLERG